MKKLANRGCGTPWALKLDLKMKLSFLFLFTTIFALQANSSYAQNTKVSLHLENVTVAEALDEIEATTEFKFLFNVKDVDLTREVSIKVRKQRIDKILDRLFSRTATSYEIDDRTILLHRTTSNESTKENVQVTADEDQQARVSGTVTDENGGPLPAASIVEKGTTNGVSSDFDGNYTIEISNTDAILQVSYLGYTTLEVPVNGQTTINVQLQPDTGQLEEVVVIGYGTTTKEKFNGAVSKVENEKLNNFSSANFEQALSGNVAGVQVVGNGKNPGENSVIQIRGLSTLTAGTNPLIVVDGNPLSEGSSFSSINTQDIESVNILKDAASAAIYGSRASNGVILITTKKGKQGKLRVTYDTYFGFSGPCR